MKTNDQIYSEIEKDGFITKSNLQLLKNRSNKACEDLLDYKFMDRFRDGYGIPVISEQGEQGLKWLKKFINKKGDSNIYGYRELEIIKTATPSDFLFQGFYNAGNYLIPYYLPIYSLNGMQYVPKEEPYIIR